MYILNNVPDIFMLPQTTQDAVVITTNGMLKQDGTAVMGKGIALAADQRFHIAQQLGEYIRQYGNQVYVLGVKKDEQTGRLMSIITFPTKYDWRNPADINLIQVSAQQLIRQCARFEIQNCYMPRPGCTNGGLNFETQVKPILEPILDNKFIITDYQ